MADFGHLLIFELQRDAEACPRLEKAMTSGFDLRPAQVGYALCQIRYGEGSVGFELISAALERDPGDVQAGLVLAEYHLRSHHWDHAAMVYGAILEDRPTLYVALRGFHETCLHAEQMQPAILAWQVAVERAPERVEFASYLAWALAIADDPIAARAADQVFEKVPDDRLACLAHMLLALRAGRVAEAESWVARGLAGRVTPGARALDRARETLRVLRGQGNLGENAAVMEILLRIRGGLNDRERVSAQAQLRAFVEQTPDADWKDLAQRLLFEIDPGESEAQEMRPEAP
jgi:hypothetical protein